MQTSSGDVRGCDVNDRSDLPRSFLGTVWPLAALALLLLMLVRACVPAAPAATVAAQGVGDSRPADR